MKNGTLAKSWPLFLGVSVDPRISRFEAQGRILLANLQTVRITAKAKVTKTVLRLPIIGIESYASTMFGAANDSNWLVRYLNDLRNDVDRANSLKSHDPARSLGICRRGTFFFFFFFLMWGKPPAKGRTSLFGSSRSQSGGKT